MKWIGILIGVTGSTILGYEAGWKVFLAVYFMIWGNNLYIRGLKERGV